MKTLTAATLIRPQVPPTAAAAAAAAVQNPLSNRHVAFTTPPFYGERLASLLHHRGAVPVPIPTVIVEPIPRTIAALRPFICSEELGRFSSLLFTSRTGISAIALALDDAPPPLSDSGEPFIIAALGRDAEHLHELGLIHKLCRSRHRIQVIEPKVASPSGLVEALGEGFGRRALCPVPDVVGLEEPPVVPDFLKALEASGWVPTRVPAYETRWAGPKCAEELVREAELETLDAIVFTSTTEVEGLMKSLEAMGWSWSAVSEKRPRMLVATHGPVTANGAQRFGVAVDVVSSSFSSFNGVLDALAVRWADSCEQQ